MEETVDVVVMGGGIAGLAISCQLKSNDPTLAVTVVEKGSYPVPETAHKVGESTLPIAAHYLSEIIGLRDHLKDGQVTKLGMRFFGTRDGNEDISRRPESGIRRPPPIPSYQLAHGRIENILQEQALSKGIKVIEGARVSNVDLGDPSHTVRVTLADGTSAEVSGHWLIDASGRAAVLKNKLGLAEEVPHRGQAAWFRVADRIAVDEWSDDPEWHSRVMAPERWRSTVHLHGAGYWVWLIALPDGVTSIGLVADPDYVSFDEMRRFEPLLEWMRHHEPQLAREIESRTDLIEDFQTRVEYPRGSSQIYSPERWFITGDAGIFLDPLYSPGLDFISISNTFITGLIMDERRGVADMPQRTAEADGLFRTFANLAFGLYSNQYELFGNPEIISAKFTWETIVYFAFGAPLAFADSAIDDPASLAQKIAPEIAKYATLLPAFHNLLNDWNALAGDSTSVAMVSATDEIMDGIQVRLVEASDSEEEVIELIRENLQIMETTFVEMVEGVAGGLGLEAPADPNWSTDPQALLEFRLASLPRRADGKVVVPSGAGAGLCWSTPDDPDGAVNDHQSSWPGLRGGELFAPPEMIPNALETAR